MKKILDVKVTFITLTLKAKWPKIKPEKLPYPFVSLSSWARYMLEKEPRYFLGGCPYLSASDVYCETLKKFWTTYRGIDPNHPIFTDFNEADMAFTIPYAIHGDEGRGRNFIPTLVVVAYQMVIPGRGMEHTSTAGYPV